MLRVNSTHGELFAWVNLYVYVYLERIKMYHLARKYKVILYVCMFYFTGYTMYVLCYFCRIEPIDKVLPNHLQILIRVYVRL